MAEQASPRARQWAETMAGHAEAGLVRAHAGSLATARPGAGGRRASGGRNTSGCGCGPARRSRSAPVDGPSRRNRTRNGPASSGTGTGSCTPPPSAGWPARPRWWCIPSDHQRTRLTHALEVAQIATSIARGAGVNVALADAIALGHDCGHGPGGHASEDAFDAFMPEGYEHGPWGADVVLAPLNLCAETLDGIRNHSWSRPAPQTVEGEIVSWADRIAYCAHDLEDAIHAGIVRPDEVPAEVVEVCGRTRREQLGTFVRAVVAAITAHGEVGMAEAPGVRPGRASAPSTTSGSTSARRRSPSPGPWSRCCGRWSSTTSPTRREPPRPTDVRPGSDEAVRAAVAYVAGMTDRYAFDTAVRELGWDPARLPQAVS